MHVPARLTHVADTLLSRHGEMGSLLVWFVDCDSLGPRLLYTFFSSRCKNVIWERDEDGGRLDAHTKAGFDEGIKPCMQFSNTYIFR